MRVFVNNVPVSVFEGAKVRDAVNKYSSVMFIKGRLKGIGFTVYDGMGNTVMKDGSLNENDHIYLRMDTEP